MSQASDANGGRNLNGYALERKDGDGPGSQMTCTVLKKSEGRI
jgi:hypothetical protein